MTDTQAFVEISSRSAAGLAEKYLALWNEPDAERRRQGVTALWTDDALHVLQPPEAVRQAAAALAVESTFQARGHLNHALQIVSDNFGLAW